MANEETLEQWKARAQALEVALRVNTVVCMFCKNLDENQKCTSQPTGRYCGNWVFDVERFSGIELPIGEPNSYRNSEAYKQSTKDIHETLLKEGIQNNNEKL
jgi:hypothetical protein